jgi:hypothetical protein
MAALAWYASSLAQSDADRWYPNCWSDIIVTACFFYYDCCRTMRRNSAAAPLSLVPVHPHGAVNEYY